MQHICSPLLNTLIVCGKFNPTMLCNEHSKNMHQRLWMKSRKMSIYLCIYKKKSSITDYYQLQNISVYILCLLEYHIVSLATCYSQTQLKSIVSRAFIALYMTNTVIQAAYIDRSKSATY